MEKSEDNLIAWIQSRFPKGDLPIGIGDDMAMLPPSETGLLVTADMLMDGVDFDTAVHTPEQIGRKALAVSLSDCAAMAVRPRWAMVSVALPNAWSMEMAQRLYLGIEKLAKQFECRVVGGDTNSWDNQLVIDMMVIAEPWGIDAGRGQSLSPGHVRVASGDRVIPPIRRDGVRAGDEIWVTGKLGGSLLGHHLSFQPRVKEALVLATSLGSALHAMLDLSDGLSTDAHRMARASECGIELEEAALASIVSEAARTAAGQDGRTVLGHLLNDGEDFELLFAIDPRDEASVDRSGLVECTRIGVAVTEKGVWLRRADGSRQAVESAGWQHFKA